MSVIGSRSSGSKNVVEFRHASFFEDYEDFTGDIDAFVSAHPELDSAWKIRKSSVNRDEEEILFLMRDSSIDWADAVKQYEETGDVATPRLKTDGATRQRAELAIYTVGFVGPALSIPDDYTRGDYDGSEDETPHELAGQVLPVDPMWINMIPGPVIDAAFLFMREQHARRSKEQEATFPAQPAPAHDADGPADGRGNRRKRKPAVSAA